MREGWERREEGEMGGGGRGRGGACLPIKRLFPRSCFSVASTAQCLKARSFIITYFGFRFTNALQLHSVLLSLA